MKEKLIKTRGQLAGQIVIHGIMIVACLLVIIPLLLMLIVSFSSETSVQVYGYSFFPKEWSLDAYKFVFSDSLIFRAYLNTIVLTVGGTALAVLVCSMCAYTLAKPSVKHRNKLAFFLYLPTIFNAGLIPWYTNIAYTLHLKDSFFALMIPLMVGAFNVFLIRNYFKSVPAEILESASIDGANDFVSFTRILIPLSMPIIATVSLFIALGYWNDWYLATWFIDTETLYPLQYFLYKIESLLNYIKVNGSLSGSSEPIPTQTVLAAAMFVTVGPIVFVYPFLQKYFVKGIMVGGVKG